MPPGAGNRYAVQKLKEVKIQGAEQRICSAYLWVEFTPCVECFLGLPKNLVNRFLCIQLFVDELRIALIRNGKLIFQIDKAVVDRGGR